MDDDSGVGAGRRAIRGCSCGLIDADDLAGLLRSGAGRWGSRRVWRAFDLVDGRSESPPGSWVRVACAMAGLPAPVPQFDVVHEGVWLARADLAWPEAELIVEDEGEYHFDGVQIARDDVRIQRLIAAGWRVIRLAAHHRRHMDAVVERIREALAEAARVTFLLEHDQAGTAGALLVSAPAVPV